MLTFQCAALAAPRSQLQARRHLGKIARSTTWAATKRAHVIIIKLHKAEWQTGVPHAGCVTYMCIFPSPPVRPPASVCVPVSSSNQLLFPSICVLFSKGSSTSRHTKHRLSASALWIPQFLDTGYTTAANDGASTPRARDRHPGESSSDNTTQRRCPGVRPC